ncbi:MAG: UPF0175 family protein [Candidatus Diapherotrites archaeon]|nr:UPF0175 family protein [Candidatus Diapherotrites archaeon]MDZ4256509.1 UPF0175 family protein [archaeon]
MNGSQAIGIRVEKDMLAKIDDMGKTEKVDRSTAIRMLLEEGYKAYLRRKAAEWYKAGKLTMSQAAMDAHISIWEMEQYLVRHGYKSQYSVEDMQQELGLLSKKSKPKGRK